MSDRIVSADKSMSEEEFANLSDEEIMNMQFPPSFSTSEESQMEIEQEETEEEEDNDSTVLSTADEDEEQQDYNSDIDPESNDESEEDDDDTDAASNESEPFEEEGEEEKRAETVDEETSEDSNEDSEESGSENNESSIDYKAVYDSIFAPFKANGKEIKVNSPEEVIDLMQMGANYTKKLQALKPHLKMVKMLENQGLLDEQKLAYLIDLSKGDAAAVQKLVKESGIDPMEIDTDKESGYKPGNYRVSDEEMAFTSVLEDVSSDPNGKEVIRFINKTWDTQSKNALWEKPELLKILAQQKSNGIFDQIASEVDRRQMLGQMTGLPYLEAYYAVGQEMQQNGQLNVGQAPQAATGTPQSNAQSAPTQNRPVGTRKVAKKKPDNSARVKAASPMKPQSKSVQEEFNPLALSDEEFEKRAAMGTRF